MSISFDIIWKAISKKIAGRENTGRFPPLPKLKKIILKHSAEGKLNRFGIGAQMLLYSRPWELLHSYPEIFEKEIYRFTAATDSPLIIDCGANIGMSVLYFKWLYPRSVIIAFEPDQKNFELLSENCKLNKWMNVELRQKAVWTNNEAVLFSASGSQGSRIENKEDPSGDQFIKVPAQRLAELLQQQPVDFLKIDIEGAEYDVMMDCRPWLANVKNLFLEYHGSVEENTKLTGLLQLLTGSGFGFYILEAADNIPQPFVNKKATSSFDLQLNIFAYRL